MNACGSDAALGVWFYTDDGRDLSLAEFEQETRGMTPFEMPGAQSLFPDGSSAVCCTNYAAQVSRGLPDRQVEIVGFAEEDNPASRLAQTIGGHDFALVDGQYLVDPWVRLVAAESEQILFDLQDETDAAIVADMYGPRECWTALCTKEELTKMVREV